MQPNSAYDKIAADPRFADLVSKRNRFALAMSFIVLAVFSGFVFVAVAGHGAFAAPIAEGSPWTWGIIGGWLFVRIDVGEVWGVGRRIAARLHVMGIHTVQELKDAPPRDIRAQFGVVMERTCQELRGLSCLALEEVAPRQVAAQRPEPTVIGPLDRLQQCLPTQRAKAILVGVIDHPPIASRAFHQGCMAT